MLEYPRMRLLGLKQLQYPFHEVMKDTSQTSIAFPAASVTFKLHA